MRHQHRDGRTYQLMAYEWVRPWECTGQEEQFPLPVYRTTCRDCGDEFVFTHGARHLRVRCKPCVGARRERRRERKRNTAGRAATCCGV